MLLEAALILQSVTVPGTQLDVQLATQVGQPYDAATVQRDVRWLWSLGRFDDIRVEQPEPGALVFHVRRRERLSLREIRLEPHTYGVELSLPRATPIDPVRAREIARGVEQQLHLKVKETLVPRGHGEADLKLRVIPDKGKRSKAAPSDEIRYSMSKDLCRTLYLERRDAEREGRLDFAARFDFDRGLTVERGRTYTVGRIEFTGNHQFPDALVRRHFVVDEGAVFDERLLRLSLARLNRSGLFNPVGGQQVVLARDRETGVADVHIHLTERRPGSWKFAGPWPLEAAVSARLPKWATYAASVSVFGSSLKLLDLPTRFVPVFAVHRPYSPGEGWTSGFSIAPQIRPKGWGISYVATQAQQRLLPAVSGERSAEPPLAITGDAGMTCEERPKLVRKAATFLVQFVGSMPII
jgi:hypothetical protein